MDIDPRRLELQFFDSEENPLLDHVLTVERKRNGPAGLFVDPKKKGKLIIALDVRIVPSAPQVAATLAHELAHVHLLADKRLKPEEEDHEQVADLLTVFFGIGIISANAAFHFSQWQYGQWAGWSAGRSGYLSEQEYGWALANYAWLRDEFHPAWAVHLAYNVLTYFRESLRYLEKTGATSLSRGIARGTPAQPLAATFGVASIRCSNPRLKLSPPSRSFWVVAVRFSKSHLRNYPEVDSARISLSVPLIASTSIAGRNRNRW